MKDLSQISGIEELDMINLYALEELTDWERQLVEKMNQVVEECEKGKGEIFGFNEQGKIQMLWKKYEHLKPFRSRFDPEKIIPEVFKNKTAFTIRTVWKSRHLVCEDDLLEEGCIAAARILAESKPPFPEEVRKHAIQEFLEYLHRSYPREDEVAFWEQHIFPYLEGKWKFKWEIIQKCFFCSKDAIAICDSISPTSDTGKTPERPFCEDCIVSTPGINIVKWLVPRHEGEKAIKHALRKLKSKEIKSKQNVP